MKKIILFTALAALAIFGATLAPAAVVRADSSTGEQPVSTTPPESITEKTESTKPDSPVTIAPDDAK